jgi:hypothetical protein
MRPDLNWGWSGTQPDYLGKAKTKDKNLVPHGYDTVRKRDIGRNVLIDPLPDNR